MVIPLSNTHKRWINTAHKLALKSDHPQFKLGAVIVKGGSLISSAANMNRFQQHAEFRSISPYQDYTGAKLYVVRKDYRSSFPCLMCLTSILNAGIKDIYFHDRDGNFTNLYIPNLAPAIQKANKTRTPTWTYLPYDSSQNQIFLR